MPKHVPSHTEKQTRLDCCMLSSLSLYSSLKKKKKKDTDDQIVGGAAADSVCLSFLYFF